MVLGSIQSLKICTRTLPGVKGGHNVNDLTVICETIL
jgi:hypothetical protein